MTWQTIEHLVTHDDAIEIVSDRLNESVLLVEYANEMLDIDDVTTLSEGIVNQLHGTMGQFPMFTAEALDALPDQVYKDLMDSEFTDNISIQDDVATALTAIEPLNGSVFTYQEALSTLPYFGMDKPAPITDNYDVSFQKVITTHDGPMNETQLSYNNLSDEQKEFLLVASEITGHDFVVDSTQEFAHGSAQFRADDEYMSDPYGLNEIAELSNQWLDDALVQ